MTDCINVSVWVLAVGVWIWTLLSWALYFTCSPLNYDFIYRFDRNSYIYKLYDKSYIEFIMYGGIIGGSSISICSAVTYFVMYGLPNFNFISKFIPCINFTL